MSISVGIPMMFLDRVTHFGSKNDKHGNMKAVIDEALKDENGVRKCNDKDYRPELTATNKYYGVMQDMTADALCGYYDSLADDYRVKVNTKNGVKERKLREDADIAFALIVKPEIGAMQAMTPQEQDKFLEDSYETMCKVFCKYGVLVDVCVQHNDEGNPHLHMIGHDADFKLSKKLGLKFFNDLNHGMYVREMRSKGWDIAPKQSNFVEDTKYMSDDEKDAYKAKKKAERQDRHGKSSEQYKLQQEYKKLEEAVKNKQAELAGLKDLEIAPKAHKEEVKKEPAVAEEKPIEKPLEKSSNNANNATKSTAYEAMRKKYDKDKEEEEKQNTLSVDDVADLLLSTPIS